jgi:hypothetical protein
MDRLLDRQWGVLCELKWEMIAPWQLIFALFHMIYMNVEFCISVICLELHLNKKKRTLGAIVATAFEVRVIDSADISG